MAGLGDFDLSENRDDDKEDKFDWRKHLLARVEELHDKVAILFESGRLTSRPQLVN